MYITFDEHHKKYEYNMRDLISQKLKIDFFIN